ncbi:hypothetical protein [Thermococcus sp. GR4]|uniref:hypothetical protein n=1 Tax=Thermococcus sp. GR4 TaxID=1638254 RepID=UPI0014311DA3|nr:hypothetical protein [Thermococcus sp. GR4]NJE79424.1 hypothetical protein [Thermococcus sp. GR4]
MVLIGSDPHNKSKIRDAWESEKVKKIIEALEFFCNGDKTIADWLNVHNQYFDGELFRLLISEGLLKVPDISENEKRTLEKDITLLTEGKYPKRPLKVTKDGYMFLSSYYFNKRSLELNERAVKLNEEVAKLTQDMKILTVVIACLTIINVILVAYSILGS